MLLANGTKSPRIRGKAVKDERPGGHRSASSAADEDGAEAIPLARVSSLTALGAGSP